MQRFFQTSLFVALALTVGLAGCQKDSDTATGLAGTWQLTNRQCYCASTPLPDEKVTFTETSFTFYKAGQLTAQGTYSPTTGQTFCGAGGANIPLHLFTYTTPAWLPQKLLVTVTANTLVIDHGGACDAAVDTFKRLP